MDKDYKIISIITLVVGIIGISIGFAAFSNILTIKSSANVTPDSSTFNVIFSSSNTEQKTDAVTAVLSDYSSSMTADNLILDNSKQGFPTIEEFWVNFTEPGQYATYTFYVHNAGGYDAYLKSIVFLNKYYKDLKKEEKSYPYCEIDGENKETSIDISEVCNGFSVTIDVDDKSATDEVLNDITNHVLLKDQYKKVTVKVEYKTDSKIPDKKIKVSFGDIGIIYSSNDNNIDLNSFVK